MVDLQGRIVFASQRAAEQHGVLDPAELFGRQATDFVIDSERDRFRASIGRLIEEGVHRNVEYTLLRKDGTTFDAEVSSAVISDAAGKPEAFMAVYRDISERKQADEVMRQTLDQLAAIYDGMIEGLLITDIETKRFVRVNAPFCRMLGYSEEELLAKAIKDIHPAEEVPNDERRFQAAAEGRVSFNEERPVLRKDGSIFYADITGHRIFYDERPCLLALFRDVTERRQAEAKLKAEQNALRRMVLASDHERRLITYELHDGVAQQLMGAIMHFQSQEPPPGGTPSANDAYREGMKALRQASSEIRSVMSRLRTPVLDMYGLAEAIEDVAAQLRSIPGAPEIECRYDIQFERLEPTLEISLFRIAQEAVTNACRHSKSEKVRVQLTQKGDWVALEVRDWGIGFDKATIQGNRFGLEGIRQRSRLLGGNLSIKSKPGEGTVVRVKFPVMEATDDE
jgi:PAS domain S-box-containing protein